MVIKSKKKPHFRGLTPHSSTVFAVCPKCDTMLEPDFCEKCSKCNTYIDWEGVFGYEEQEDEKESLDRDS